MSETKPYRPSSGTEGMDFMEEFCFRCTKYGDDDKPEEHCPIEEKVTLYERTDPRYPKEWVADDVIGTNARCTAFEPKP